MDFIVGNTGFVGSNLILQHEFDGMFHSTNISEAFGKKPDLLVYAGVRSEMFLANQDCAADRQHIGEAIENIRRIQPVECILISTIAVYQDTHTADEDTEIKLNGLNPYGTNRLYLEQWVEKNIDNSLIIRLPAIYGKNLKKNFLYDFIHVIPPLLTAERLKELLIVAPQLKNFYLSIGNGFYKCRDLNLDEKNFLKELFMSVGFSALNFTDSRSEYQFYALKNLWKHIEIARKNHLKKLNVTAPPLSAAEVYRYLTGGDFVNILNKTPYSYDLHSKYAKLFGGDSGYIISREQEMDDIFDFVHTEMETDI